MEPLLAESVVVGQGCTQVADPDYDDREIPGQPQSHTDLLAQLGAVVADPPYTVSTEERHILADLGGVHVYAARQHLG